MTHKPQIGRNVYRDALVRGRNGTTVARRAMLRIVEENPGPQTTALLIAKAALALGEIEAALNELDEIGRNAKAVSSEK